MTVELPGLEAVLERARATHPGRRAASATRHLRRSPGARTSAASWSRRSRPDEPPSSATLTTAVISPAYCADRARARRRVRGHHRARRPPGPPRTRPSDTVDDPGGAPAGEKPSGRSALAERVGDRRRCGDGHRCSRYRSRGTPCPRARTRGAAARTADRARRGTRSPRPGRARSRGRARRRRSSGRSSSTQCGFGRNRQSKRRSTSSGMPCL